MKLIPFNEFMFQAIDEKKMLIKKKYYIVLLDLYFELCPEDIISYMKTNVKNEYILDVKSYLKKMILEN